MRGARKSRARRPYVLAIACSARPLSMKRSRLPLLVAMSALTACSDEAPVSGPGTLTAVVVSPNGAEGAAQIVLAGSDIGPVTAIGDTEAYSESHLNSTSVVLINQVGGELSFQVAVPDTTRPPRSLVLQVAGPEDQLRTGDFELRYVR